MSRNTRLSVPYISDGQPGRYGRDFYDPEIGSGRIEEAPPARLDPDANVVGRVIVRFDGQEEEAEKLGTVDTKEVAKHVGGVPGDVYAFRRQIIHEDRMIDAIDKCIDHARQPDHAINPNQI